MRYVYHVQVAGHLVRINLTRNKAEEYADLLKDVCPDKEISILVERTVPTNG